MPADRKDLQARLAAATPHDTVRGVVFNGAFDVLHERLDADRGRRCDPRGTARRTAFLSYPVTEYLALAWNAADALEEAVGGVDRAFFLIGHRALANVFSSPVLGGTLKTLGGGNPTQLLANVHPGYRATVNYGERSMEVMGPRHARITFRHDFLVPPFHCGVLTAAVESVGATDIRVTGVRTAFLEAVYDIRWVE
jgi:uncharacterized protein (TIGR02265 family)